MGDGGVGDWCVLTVTAAAQTLPLVTALTEEGYRAWSPTEVRQRRARRSIPAQQITVALMPRIVFAGYDQLTELIGLTRSAMQYQVWDAQLRRMVVKGLPHFRVLRIADRYARVSDGELRGLRQAESVRLTIAKRKTFQAGHSVRLMTGLLEGACGTVVSVRGSFAKVRFEGWPHPLEIAFQFLESVDGSMR